MLLKEWLFLQSTKSGRNGLHRWKGSLSFLERRGVLPNSPSFPCQNISNFKNDLDREWQEHHMQEPMSVRSLPFQPAVL